ncbi:MAG TPA: hypothetical protein VGS59_03130 [Candidatus Acidoferrales bacterium]|nr:hypothetical protein [Candidatus Acidoferrales bacterium]
MAQEIPAHTQTAQRRATGPILGRVDGSAAYLRAAQSLACSVAGAYVSVSGAVRTGTRTDRVDLCLTAGGSWSV